MPIGTPHDHEDSTTVRVRDVAVEQVGHGIDEDHSRCAPPLRLCQTLWPEADRERIDVVGLFIDRGQAVDVGVREASLCENTCVTVVATCTYSRATRDRVPCRICPLDRGSISHRAPIIRAMTRARLRRKVPASASPATIWRIPEDFPKVNRYTRLHL